MLLIRLLLCISLSTSSDLSPPLGSLFPPPQHACSPPPAVDSNTLSAIDPHNCDASAWKQTAFQIILMWDTDLVPTQYECYPQLEISHHGHTTIISYREKSPTPSLSVFQCLKYGGVTAHNCVQG